MSENKDYTKQLEEQVAALEDKLEENDKEIAVVSKLEDKSAYIISCIVAELCFKIPYLEGMKRRIDKANELGEDCTDEDRERIGADKELFTEYKHGVINLLNCISPSHHNAGAFQNTLDSMLEILKNKGESGWESCGDGNAKSLEKMMPFLREIIND